MYSYLSSSIKKQFYDNKPHVIHHHHHHYDRPAPTGDFKIVIVLDESGSMQTIRHQMIKAINDLIMEQKQVVGRPATFTLVKFNQNTNRVVTDMPLKDVDYLTEMSYSPSGSTALYDAIGETITRLKHDRDVLMVIVTDGQENASRHYRKYEIESMIESKKSAYGWTYVYLSNDLSTFDQGNDIGLVASAAVTNCVVEQAQYGSFLGSKLNKAISNFRKDGRSVQSQL